MRSGDRLSSFCRRSLQAQRYIKNGEFKPYSKSETFDSPTHVSLTYQFRIRTFIFNSIRQRHRRNSPRLSDNNFPLKILEEVLWELSWFTAAGWTAEDCYWVLRDCGEDWSSFVVDGEFFTGFKLADESQIIVIWRGHLERTFSSHWGVDMILTMSGNFFDLLENLTLLVGLGFEGFGVVRIVGTCDFVRSTHSRWRRLVILTNLLTFRSAVERRSESSYAEATYVSKHILNNHRFPPPNTQLNTHLTFPPPPSPHHTSPSPTLPKPPSTYTQTSSPNSFYSLTPTKSLNSETP